MLADTAIGFIVDLDNIAEKLLARYPTNRSKPLSLACVVVWIAGFVQFLSYKKNPETKSPYSIPEAAWGGHQGLARPDHRQRAVKDWEAKHGAHQNGDSKTPNKNEKTAPRPSKPAKIPRRKPGRGERRKKQRRSKRQQTRNAEQGVWKRINRQGICQQGTGRQDPRDRARKARSDGTSTRDESSPQEPSGQRAH